MKNDFNQPSPSDSRSSFILVIVALYLLPIVGLSAYSLGLMPLNSSWGLFSLGLTMAMCGSVLFFFMLHRWESSLMNQRPPHHEIQKRLNSSAEIQRVFPPAELLPEHPVPAPLPTPAPDPLEQERLIQAAVEAWQRKHTQLLTELSAKEEAHQELLQEHEKIQRQLQAAVHELSTFQDGVHIQLEQKDQQIAQHQHTIADQRSLIEKHQQHIGILESKERDLSYEIKTLLQLTNLESFLGDHSKPVDGSSSSFQASASAANSHFQAQESGIPYRALERPIFNVKRVDSPESAAAQLKHCLDIATKMTGANYLIGSSSRVPNLPVDNYALDLRRLCDSLNSESSTLLLLFSQRENKLLFVNDQAKNILGWSSDKFTENFPEMVSSSSEEWKRGLNQLATETTSALTLNLRAKNGPEMPFYCVLGAVPAGPFRHHVIGILYESKQANK